MTLLFLARLGFLFALLLVSALFFWAAASRRR